MDGSDSSRKLPEMNGIAYSRKLLIMRHAERVDQVFGSWIPSSFDENGVYRRTNLNMPESIPIRRDAPGGFQSDSPITRIGEFQARLTGEAMKDAGEKFSHVFSSPALRCVQTCSIVLKSAELDHLPINIEPGLFECMSIYRNREPAWMGEVELRSNGFNVSEDYDPIMPAESLPSTEETFDECFERHFIVTKEISQKFSGNIFFVAHSTNLNSCGRQLTGRPLQPDEERTAIRIFYASVAMVEENPEGVWELVEPPILPLKHGYVDSFDWREFL